MIEPLQEAFMQRALAEIALIGLASGALGCWVVLYEFSYAAESLAHSIFPGLVIATLAGIPLLLGAAPAIAIAALAIALAGRVPGVGRDVAVAVVVTTMFGLGVLLALSPDSPPGIETLLFGDILGPSDADLVSAAVLAVLVAAALALLVAPAVATAAAPGVQDGLLTSERADVDQRLAMIEASGARVARVEVLWSEVAPRAPRSPGSPADPAYRFERLDAVVAGLAEREITPIITIYSAPAWAARERRASPGRVNAFGPAPSRFAVFMQAVAHRYSGSYADILRGTLPRVRHYELWNRPNDARFLRPQRSGGRAVGLAAYVAMVRAATPRIRRMNASAIVIAGAAAGTTSSSAAGTAARTWLRGLARSRAAFDAYSQQLQPAAGPRQPTRAFPSWRSIGELEAELDAVPRRRGMALYITRAGYRTAPPSGRGALPEARQASYLRQIWGLPAIRSPRVPAVIWHDLQDGPGSGFGLLRADGTPKPSHAAFARLSAPLRALPSELHR